MLCGHPLLFLFAILLHGGSLFVFFDRWSVSTACAGNIRHGREPGGMDGFVLHFVLLFLFDRLFS